MRSHAVVSAAASLMSTATSCATPLRTSPISVAARAAAAIDACAAVPTANDDGRTGSAPVSVRRSSAFVGRPSDDQSASTAAVSETGRADDVDAAFANSG